MKSLFYLGAVSALLITSCKKDNNENSDVVTPQNTINNTKYMYPLAIGNYWVYGEIIIDSNGIQTPTSIIDSVYIDKDTVINGSTYFRMFQKGIYQPQGAYMFYRDSAGYRVSVYGIVPPINDNVGDTLETSITSYSSAYQIVSMPPASIVLPSGNFSNLCAVRIDRYYNPPFITNYNPIKDYKYFSATIGILSYQYYFSSSPWLIYERRLISYNLN